MTSGTGGLSVCSAVRRRAKRLFECNSSECNKGAECKSFCTFHLPLDLWRSRLGGRGGMEIRRRRSTQEMTEEEKEGGEKKVGWVQEKLVRCKLAGENALTAHSAPDLWERRWVAGGVVGS